MQPTYTPLRSAQQPTTRNRMQGAGARTACARACPNAGRTNGQSPGCAAGGGLRHRGLLGRQLAPQALPHQELDVCNGRGGTAHRVSPTTSNRVQHGCARGGLTCREHQVDQGHYSSEDTSGSIPIPVPLQAVHPSKHHTPPHATSSDARHICSQLGITQASCQQRCGFRSINNRLG
jgi:hypothetical protein